MAPAGRWVRAATVFDRERQAAEASALAQDDAGRVWQSTDYGEHWAEVARPPFEAQPAPVPAPVPARSFRGEPSRAITCSLVGCVLAHESGLGTWLRLGWPIDPPRAPPNSLSLLAQEASAVTYNFDTDTLFVTGDGGTSIVQVSKTGALIDSMSLPSGSSPQGTEFYDTEGISYVGGGKFALIEERYRQVNLFTYVAGGTLTRAAVQTVKRGTTIGNIGLEGLTYDPATGHYIFVKEKDPKSIFETGIDFAAGSPGIGNVGRLIITEVAPWASGGTAYAADWFDS